MSPTKAPWEAVGTSVYGKSGTEILYGKYNTRSGSMDERIANAKLMAAAPELLHALVEVMAHLEDCMDVEDGDDGPKPNWAMQVLNSYGEMARAALQKAG